MGAMGKSITISTEKRRIGEIFKSCEDEDSNYDRGDRCVAHDQRGHEHLGCSKPGYPCWSRRVPRRVLHRRGVGGMLHRTQLRLLPRDPGLLLSGAPILPAFVLDRKP